MLARYKIYRGKRPDGAPRPEGLRQDTRKHTRHILRPTSEMVARFLGDPTTANWRTFEREYLATLEERFTANREAFDRLAELARGDDVYLGCNCPTQLNPDVRRCHTTVALRFMKRKYPELDVGMP